MTTWSLHLILSLSYFHSTINFQIFILLLDHSIIILLSQGINWSLTLILWPEWCTISLFLKFVKGKKKFHQMLFFLMRDHLNRIIKQWILSFFHFVSVVCTQGRQIHKKEGRKLIDFNFVALKKVWSLCWSLFYGWKNTAIG